MTEPPSRSTRPSRPRRPVPAPVRLEPREGFTAVGRVLRAHGLHGELRVQAFADDAPNLQVGRPVYLRGERHTVLRARHDRGAWILRLSALNGRAAAESLRDELIEAADADLRRSHPDAFFVHELIGLRVVTSDGRDLGRVTEVLQTGANDVYIVSGDGGEVLIPAIGDVIDIVNVSEGFISITPLPGLLDESK